VGGEELKKGEMAKRGKGEKSKGEKGKRGKGKLTIKIRREGR
jgi:hypothetical protein